MGSVLVQRVSAPVSFLAGCAGEVMVVGREEGGEGRREKLETASLVAPDPDSSPFLAWIASWLISLFYQVCWSVSILRSGLRPMRRWVVSECRRRGRALRSRKGGAVRNRLRPSLGSFSSVIFIHQLVGNLFHVSFKHQLVDQFVPSRKWIRGLGRSFDLVWAADEFCRISSFCKFSRIMWFFKFGWILWPSELCWVRIGSGRGGTWPTLLLSSGGWHLWFLTSLQKNCRSENSPQILHFVPE